MRLLRLFPVMNLDGLGQGFFGGPTKAVHSFREGAWVDTCQVRPFRHGHCFAIVGKPSIVISIVLLLFHRYPSAIHRRVAATVVDPVNSVFWGRRLAHVGQKVLKGFLPAVANWRLPFIARRNTAFQINPDHISFARRFSRFMAVLGVSLNTLFPMNISIEATTGARDAFA